MMKTKFNSTIMEKLTIEVLAPYLPYKLQMNSGKLGFTGELLMLKNTGDFTVSCSDWYEQISDNKYLPILRPLSDLTKEIEHKGDRFIPLLELYKISKGVFQFDIKYHSVMATNQIQIEMEGYRNYFFGLFNSEGDVRLGSGYNFRMYSTDLLLNDNKGEEVQFQNLLFKKLYEWKFDLNSLLEKGLAIDINSLTNK